MIASDKTAVLQKEYETKKTKLIEACKPNAKSETLGLLKDTSNLFRTYDNHSKNKTDRIDVRSFNKVISVDPVNLIAEVEGMATFEHIVHETLKYNCLPCVVPELKSITIGGALSGVGIESSSFRYGLVHETILEFEVLLGDGRVITCTPNNEHRDLFYAFPNSYGSLGYALKIKLKLVPAKKYVILNHLSFSSEEDFFEKIKSLCHSSISYIDAVVFDKNSLYITLGEFTDNIPENRSGKSKQRWPSNYKYLNKYYESIQNKKEDYLTTEDYIWRWDSDWFWCSKHFGMQYFLPRLLFGKWMLKSTVYWKIRKLFNHNKFASKILNWIQGPTESVIQDIQVPIENAVQFLDFFQKEIGIKPIWICPVMSYQNEKSNKSDKVNSVQYPFYNLDPEKLYINFGFWDAISTKEKEGYYNRKIEKKVQELRGHKSLYSNVYYTEEEFWSIYDKTLYSKLKNLYDPNHRLRDLYEKIMKE